MHFDGTELKKGYTHKIYIRYRKDLPDHSLYVEFKGRRFEVLDAENLDERKEFICMRCAELGTSNPNNKAAEG